MTDNWLFFKRKGDLATPFGALELFLALCSDVTPSGGWGLGD